MMAAILNSVILDSDHLLFSHLAQYSVTLLIQSHSNSTLSLNSDDESNLDSAILHK